MLDTILAAVAPHICCGCGELGTNLCQGCRENITDDDFGRCAWCLRVTSIAHQCSSCNPHVASTATWVVGERSGVLKAVLDEYKFESKRQAANELAQLLVDTLPQLPADTVVTWVPTASAHIRQRGFDHAQLLVKRFSQLTDRPMQPLLKRRHNLSQHQLTRTQRLAAAKTAFGIKNKGELTAAVLLIDDIMTTGATLEACTRLLKAAGAPAVYVAVVARQPQE